MRRNGWVLSVLGAAGLTFGRLQAGDPLAEQLTPPTSDPRRSLFSSGAETSNFAQQPKRYRRGVESQLPESDLKNYYRELFGEHPSAGMPVGPAAQQAPASPAGPAAANLNKLASPTVDPTPNRAPFGPASVPSALQSKSPGAMPSGGPAATAQEVIHAALQQRADANENAIQQVSDKTGPTTGTPRPSGARPFPSAMSSGSAVPGATPGDDHTPATRLTPSIPPNTPPLDKLSPSPQPQPSGPTTIHLHPQGPAATQSLPPSRSPGRQNELTRPISIDTPNPAAPPKPRGGVMLSGGTSIGQAGITTISHTETSPSPIRAREAGDSSAASSAVTLQWAKQGELNVGQECVCNLNVKNAGQSLAQNVEVEAAFPKTVRLIDADPKPESSTEVLRWVFSSLQPGEQRTITIKMVPLERGDVATEARVRFTGQAANTFTVSEPMLAIKVEGPSDVMIGEPASHRIIVSNPGTGVAANVHLLALVPSGLEHAGGERIELTIGSLNPGESRPVSLPLIATAGGRHLIEIQARADAGLTRTAASEVAVLAPSLQATIKGPGLRYVGRQAVYAISVNNDGAAATDNVKVMYKVPEGLSFVSSDRGTQYDPASRLLSWFVGRLEKAQTAQLNVTLSSDQIGEFTHLVRATSEYGATSDAQLKTAVEGTPSLAVRVADLDDPVEVGAEAAYEIRIRNEGSAPAMNVSLACELTPGMVFQNAGGPCRHAVDQNVVRFEAIPQLAPGELATFRVVVACGRPGNLRVKALVSSDSIPEPLTTEELTKFYGE